MQRSRERYHRNMQTTASSIVEIAQIMPEQARWYCDQLERGKILFFAGTPFDFPQGDRGFLLSQKQTGSRFHKNISYRPAKDILKGVSSDSPDRERLQRVMQHFSQEATRFVSTLLAPYAGKLKLDFASFRPLEEESRDLPLHKRHDVLSRRYALVLTFIVLPEALVATELAPFRVVVTGTGSRMVGYSPVNVLRL